MFFVNRYMAWSDAKFGTRWVGDANDELLRKQQELQDMDKFDMNTTKAQRLVEYMEKCAMFDVREGQATIKRLGAAIESDDEARCRSQEDASETMMRLAYTQELLISVRNEIQRLQTSMAAEAGSSAGTTLTGAREEVLLRLLHNEERSLSDQVTALRQSLAKIDAILTATKEHQEEVERALSWHEIHVIHLWGPVETARVAAYDLQADAEWNETRRKKKTQEIAAFGGWVGNLKGKLNVYARP